MKQEPMFKGNEGKFIAPEESTGLQGKYLKGKRTEHTKEPVRSEFFGKEKIQQLLEKEGCVGIRIYHAEDQNGEPELVLVAIDENGKVITTNETQLEEKTIGVSYLSYGPKCPPIC